MNNKGFTLIEIIIVIVILGIMATLALPRLAAQTNAAQGAEAMQYFGIIKRAAATCYEATNNFTLCASQAALGVTTPQNSRFAYSFTAAATSLIITARQNAATQNHVSMVVNDAGITQFMAPATSVFQGIVNRTGLTSSIAAAASTSPF
ncbi:MAG: prepilin-type N-terminal cleavage/methylation domain-containing protein [Candidatus Omnitrophica bacterium]|nr:prepilin-type N-terminal cleavage/methylation domain-containing protein [Candidatus Omnitrophota bacterium]